MSHEGSTKWGSKYVAAPLALLRAPECHRGGVGITSTADIHRSGAPTPCAATTRRRPLNEGWEASIPRCPMPNNCPDCGATVEFNAATARVLHGDCSGCGHAFTILEGLPAIPDARIAATGAAEESSAPAGPACSSCGESMVIRAASDTTLDAVCSGCGSHFSYSLATAPVERGAPRRPRRFEPITEERGGFDRERPPSRPCRECGGALQFSTGPDGMVTGECAQCGNRFTLPPRREGGERGGGRPPFRRPGAGGFRPRFGGGGGGYSRGGDRGGPPRTGGSSYRRRPPRDDDDDSSDRRRRRPRRE